MGLASKLKVTQWVIDKAMLRVSQRDQIKNEENCRGTKVTDIARKVVKLKGHWADDKRGRKLLEWRPRTGRRIVGKPPGPTGRCGDTWRAYVQHWTSFG